MRSWLSLDAMIEGIERCSDCHTPVGPSNHDIASPFQNVYLCRQCFEVRYFRDKKHPSV